MNREVPRKRNNTQYHPLKSGVGMNARRLTPSSIKSRATTTFTWIMNIVAAVGLGLGALGVIGVAVTSAIWVYNVRDINDEISVINNEIDILIENGTLFYDDTWVMANGPQPSRKFMLNASLVSLGTKRNYAVPDTDGIFLLEETFVPVFLENEFAIIGEFDETTRMEFDLTLIPAATTHTYSWPNKDGTVAMISDIVGILVNVSTFFDSSFAIVNDPDITKVAMFYAGDITTGTTRQYGFPNINGTLALTAGAQTISDKTLDNTNSITVIDSNFAIEESAGSNAVLFNADALSTDRTVLFPNLAGTFVYTDGAQVLSDKTLDNTNSITVVDSNLAIEDTAGGNSELFDANALSTDRTASFQDKDCTLACLDDITNSSSIGSFRAVIASFYSIPSGVATTIIFENTTTLGGNNIDGAYSDVTGIFTSVNDGYYDVSCNVFFQANNNGYRTVSLAASTGTYGQTTADPTFSQVTSLSVASNHIYLPPGETVKCVGIQTSGGALPIGIGSSFAASFVAPA